MSYQTHTVSEWAAMVSLATSGYAAFSAPYFLFVDADRADFDPRPALDRAGCRVLVEVVRAKGTAREVAVSAAALYMLLTPAAAPKGATHA